MATPVQVSPLIKTARWGLLSLGVLYGYKHYGTVKVKRENERKVEIEIRDKYLADKAAAEEKARIEYERESILFQKSPPKE